MTHLYHGTIKGYWEHALKDDKLQPVQPEVIKQYINAVAPLLLGYSAWFDKRVEQFQQSEGKVFLSNSKRHASGYAITYPEVVTASLTRLRECIAEGKITNSQLDSLDQPLKELQAFFESGGQPLVATLDIPEGKFQFTGLPNEIMLLEPIKLTECLVTVEQVEKQHLFFHYYDTVKEIMHSPVKQD